MTGQEIDYNKHILLEFGEYVQPHEEHDNSMTDRTIGAICLGPTGNERETHWFMCVASGARITRTRWTPLPMPKEVIQRVSEIGQLQGAPTTLTFGDRHAREIEDNLTDLDDYSDDGSYQPSESSDDDDNFVSDDDDDVDMDGSNNSDSTDDDSDDIDTDMPKSSDEYDDESVENVVVEDDDTTSNDNDDPVENTGVENNDDKESVEKSGRQ